MSKFDLRPPSEAQRSQIIAGLTPDERRVLLEHGTEAAFCGVFLDNHRDGIYTCRFCALSLECEVRLGNRLAELLQTLRRVSHPPRARYQLWNDPGGGSLCALRQPSRPRVP